MAAQYVDLKNSEQFQPHALLCVRGIITFFDMWTCFRIAEIFWMKPTMSGIITQRSHRQC